MEPLPNFIHIADSLKVIVYISNLTVFRSQKDNILLSGDDTIFMFWGKSSSQVNRKEAVFVVSGAISM